MAQTRRRKPDRTAKREEPIETVVEAPPPPPEEPVEPRVTAILVAYNQAPALRRAIQALERSENRNRLEILVVDNGSQDESAQLDTEFEGVTMMRLPHYFGATKAMNIGTRTAKAEIVFYLSPNVEVAPDTITKLADYLEADADAAAVCPLLIDPDGRQSLKIQKIPSRATLSDPQYQRLDLTLDSVAVEYPGLDALMTRKFFIKGMNFFDERYGNSFADADLAVQIRRAQKKIRVYTAIRATYHAEPDPMAGDPLYAADRALGAAAFLGKYDGFFAGLTFRIAAILRALGRFDFRLLSALVTGQKLDGSQAM
jgi:glycosyltransferase involved in cell wall biosynthesis